MLKERGKIMELTKEIKLLKSLTVAVQDIETFNQIACDENFTNEVVMWQPLDIEQVQGISNTHDKKLLSEVNKLFHDNKLDVCYIVAEW